MTDATILNRRGVLGWLAAGGAATGFLAGKPAQAAEKNLKVENVPDKIMEAASRVAPQAKWIEAVKIDDDDKISYELDGTTATGKEITVQVTDAGKVIEVETELRDKRIPKDILEAVRAKWPKFDLGDAGEAYEIRQGEDLRGRDDGEISYDLTGHIVKDRYLRVELSAAGKFIESTIEMAKDNWPKEVTEAVHKKYPKFEIEDIYAIRQERVLTGYEVVGQRPKLKKKLTIVVSPEGTVEGIE